MPGLRGSLEVRVSDGETDRHVTKYVRGLKFTKVAPGGHQEITLTMTLPRNTFRRLGPLSRVWLYDTRTGRCVFDGYLENPTPVDGPLGQRYDVRAVGGMALANDETRALIYVTHDMTGWEPAPGSSAAASMEVGEWVGNTALQRVRTGFSGGSVLDTGTASRADFTGFEGTDTEMGGYRIGGLLSGKNDAGYTLDILSPFGTVVSGAMQTATVASTNWLPAGVQRLAVQLRRSGAPTNVADDESWTDWVDWSAIGRRLDRYGIPLTGAVQGSAISVLAHQVVEDVLGRLLTFCDPATARIDPTTWPIDQLTFLDGVKAAGVLNELANWEADHYWTIGETLPNGLHRFDYQEWNPEPRYEVSVQDGWVQAGSDVDLCNRVLVTYTDPAGNVLTEPVLASDPDVDLVGKGLPVDDLGDRVKDADPITLPDGFGSLANARRIGAQILKDAISPPKAGTVVVRRPIINLATGNEEMPWELEPGCSYRVRETGDNLRGTQVSYDDDPVAATVTLGTPVLTREQRLARLDAA